MNLRPLQQRLATCYMLHGKKAQVGKSSDKPSARVTVVSGVSNWRRAN
jgi:hypothetical protein